MVDKERFEIEKIYLQVVKKIVLDEIDKLNKDIIEIPKQYRKRYSDVAGGDEDLVDTLIKITKNRISKLEICFNNCYFGQFEFTDNAIGKKEKFYIGKTTILNDKGKVFTLDWRAPICSLYYDQNMENASYTTDEAIYTGTVNSKSQIKIQNGELIDIIDTDSVTSDEMIVSFLKQSVGNKMKDIVSSIQQEQNVIIRTPFRKNIIVQGVAGSGKTSVALHRVAYLLYNEKKYKPEQFVVIGPNSCFNDYISMVLPSLDSEGIKQITKRDLASDYGTFKYKKIVREENNTISKYKSSIKYKKDIDKFIEDYINSIDYSLTYEDFEIISSKKIRGFISSSTGNIKNKLEMTIKKVNSYLKDYQEEIVDRLREEITNGKIDIKNITKFEYISKFSSDLKSGCKTRLKKGLMSFYLKPEELYKKFIENVDIYCYLLSNKDIFELQKTTLKNLENKTITDEDMTALLYIENLLRDINVSNNIVHTVIDEAQDYGEFDFYLLRKLFKNSTFSIFGDLAQSIYSYRSIDNWNDVNDIMFAGNADILKLNQSYRTTKQISLEGNKVLQNLGLDDANPVLRNGNDVKYDDTDNLLENINYLVNCDYKTIAVLCKDDQEAFDVHKNLKKLYKEINLVNNNDTVYNGGLCVIDVMSAKGLEFDATIIYDASENKYSVDNALDLKKLYVAMTRALHELIVCSDGELTKVLKNKNEKKLVRHIM